MFHVKRPDLRDWTRAHQIADPNRRRTAMALIHDRVRAVQMTPWHGWLYLHRHAFGWAVLALALAAYAWLTGPMGWLVALWLGVGMVKGNFRG